MSDNESAEPRMAEVDEDGYPVGCQKFYHFDDTDETKAVDVFECGEDLLLFPANRKPAEKYHANLKGITSYGPFELLLGLKEHNLFAVDQCIDNLKMVKDGMRLDALTLGRAQGFVMAYDLINGLKTEATHPKKSRTPSPTPEELEEWEKTQHAKHLAQCTPEYLEAIAKWRPKMDEYLEKNPIDWSQFMKIGEDE